MASIDAQRDSIARTVDSLSSTVAVLQRARDDAAEVGVGSVFVIMAPGETGITAVWCAVRAVAGPAPHRGNHEAHGSAGAWLCRQSVPAGAATCSSGAWGLRIQRTRVVRLRVQVDDALKRAMSLVEGEGWFAGAKVAAGEADCGPTRCAL